MTVLDALVVTLNLDPTLFKKGAAEASKQARHLREEHTKSAQEMERRGEQAAQFYRKIRTEVLALAAVFTAGRGIKDWVRDITMGDAATGRLAKNLGTSVETLSIWQEAVKRTGGSAAGVSATLQGLQEHFQEFSLTNQTSVLPYFRALRVQFTGTEKDLFNLHKAVQGMDRGRALFLLRGAGIDEGTANLLLKNDAEFKKLMASVKALGVASDKSAVQGQSLENLFADLRQGADNLARSILTELNPSIIKMLTHWSEWIQKNGPSVVAKFDQLRIAIEAIPWNRILDDIGKFVEITDSAAKAVGGWTNATEILLGIWAGAKIFGLLRSIALVRLAFGGGAAAAVVGGGRAAGWLGTAIAWGARAVGAAGAGVGLAVGAGALAYQQYPNTPEGRERFRQGEAAQARNARARRQGETLTPQDVPTGDTTLPSEARGLLSTIAGTESPGYDVMYGGSRFTDFSRHPNQPQVIRNGPNAGRTSTAAGKYQFLYGTWLEAQKALSLRDFSPASQDQAAWWLARRDYRSHTGRDLLTDLRSNDPNIRSGIGAALSGTWTSLPGGIEAGTNTNRFLQQLQRNTQGVTGNLPPTGPSVSMGAAGVGPVTNNTNRSETHVNGDITVHTAATDARGIAAGIGSAIRERMGVANAQMGLA